MKKSLSPYLLAIATLAFAGSNASAAVYKWNVPSPGANNWNVNGNWDVANFPGFGGSTTDTAFFTITGTAGSATSINNIVSVNTTLGALTYTNNVNNTWHVTQIPSGVTLTVNGPVIVGGDTAAPAGQNDNTLVAMTDAGSLIATGTSFSVGNSSGVSSAPIQSATLDLSGLSNFTYNASGGTFSVGNGNRSQANMNLAGASNYITTATLNFNAQSTSSSGNGNFRLGPGTNTINANTINMAIGRLSGTVGFLTADGGLRLRGAGGTDSDRANLVLVNRNQNASSAGNNTGTLNFNGHPVDIKFGTVTMGQSLATGPSGAQQGIASINFDTGTIDATTINMAISSGNANNIGRGTITVGTNATAGLNGNLVVANLSLANQGALGSSTGIVAVVGGTMTCSGSITKTTLAGSGNIGMTSGRLTMTTTSGQIGTPAIPVDTFGLTNSVLTLSIPVVGTNVNVTTLTLDGTTNVVNVASLPAITGYPSQFPIIKYSSIAPAQGAGDMSLLGLGSLPGTFSGTLSNDTANAMVWLIISSGPAPAKAVTWKGNINGNWDTSTANWLTNGIGATYNQGDFANFDDTATTATVNLTTALTPGNITNNTASTYIFGGTGGISGTGGLDKQGTGTLIFTNSGVNDFGGGIAIENGTLQFGNGGTNGGIPASGGIVNNGALILNHSDNVTVGSVISGSGTVTQNGTGTVSPTAVNTYAGATTINAGKVIINNATGSGSSLGAVPGGAVTVAAGATIDVENGTQNSIGFTNLSTSSAKQFNIAGAGVDGNGVIVNNGSVNQQSAFQLITLTADATWGGPTRWDMRGNAAIVPQLTLNGHKLTKTNGNQISLVGANVSNGDIDINGGVLSFETTSTVQGTGTITVNPGGSLGTFRLVAGQFTRPIVLNGGTFTNLAGNGSTNDSPITLAANSTMSMNAGGNNDLYLRGAIGGSFGFTKIGTNLLVLSGTNNYTGDTTISAGALSLTNTGTIDSSRNITIVSNAILSARGRVDAKLTLTSGQTLKGNGTNDGDLAVSSGATLSPSGTGTPLGALTVNGAVTLLGTNVMDIDKAGGTNDLVAANGINYGGTLVINNLTTALDTNESYQLFSSTAGFNGAFDAIVPATPGSGLAWDTNFLTTDGTLRIVPGVVTGPTTNARILSVVRSGTNVVIHGTNNNVPNTSFHYVVLSSTNVLIPLSNWTPVVTNAFNGDGTFDYSSPIVPGTPRQFIDIQVVP